VEPTLDLNDQDAFTRGVALLREFASPAPRILGPNFGVAIAVLIHRGAVPARGDASPPKRVFHPDSGPPISTGDLQVAVCDATFEKGEAFLPGDAKGPIYKPFTDHFKLRSPGANNWRNSFDLQAGLGCDAPYTADFLCSPTYLSEPRYDCPFRDPATGHCASPAGPPGTPTCFNPNKRDVPPGPETRAQHRPKLLSRGTEGSPGYWYVEPTVDVLTDLLAAPDRRVPLYPWIAAMYGGSAYFNRWGDELSRSRFEADLQLGTERFLTLFDPDPRSPLNARLLAGAGGPGGAQDGIDSVERQPDAIEGSEPPESAERPLSTPVPFRSRNVSSLISQAGARSDPARRARLLERARKGHQRALEELASALSDRGDLELTEQLDGYDLLARSELTGHLFEVKTWTPANLAEQIRRGWAQLREYRYRNRRDLPGEVRLYLVLDRPPPSASWAWRFLVDDCEVTPAWMEGGALETLPQLADRLP
jgi:hypothetical protein